MRAMVHGRFDLCVVGGGPAGYAAAMRAHDLGKRVLLVERGRVGGAGLHEGALSSKTMWHLSNDYYQARRTDRGYRAVGVELDYRAVMDTVRAAVNERRELLERQLQRLSAPSATGGSVTLVRGSGRLTSPTSVEVTGDAGVEAFASEHFVVATGSRPKLLPGVTVDGDRIVTSDHLEHWTDFPESLVIVGAGVVGCEYATVFSNFGRTGIRIIDRQPRILPFEDEDLAERLAGFFEGVGVVIHREAQLLDLRVGGDGVEYEIQTPDGRKTLGVERALVSIGREPATSGLGLEQIGVELDRCGGIVAEQTRTTVPNVYAAGDVTADVALVNIGELEGRHAVERMFGLEPRPIRYDALSLIMFLRPEVAAVGLNEQQAQRRGLRYCVASIEHRLVDRYMAMRATRGFTKLLATPPPENRILGLRVVGPQAAACIQGVALLIEKDGTLEDLDRCVHPHPATTEGVQECARLLLGRSLHKPEVFAGDLIRCVRCGA
jgi:dihydrolipoamide dehydrogenase